MTTTARKPHQHPPTQRHPMRPTTQRSQNQRSAPHHQHGTAPDTREVTGQMSTQMTQLSELLDLKARAESQGEAIPCREFDAELWFAESPADVEFAKSLCGSCPALEACLAGALERAEPWGVWGGQLFIQGVVVARKRPRGRPRKTDVAA